jgi:undecaprenyl pyrophosphate synthase
MDLSEWGITYREFCPRKGKQSDDIGKIDQLVERETRSQAETLEEQMRKSFYAYHQLCFNCGDRNHLLQSCPSSAWSDPKDWNILSRQGR